jgi:hypothetical protein
MAVAWVGLGLIEGTLAPEHPPGLRGLARFSAFCSELRFTAAALALAVALAGADSRSTLAALLAIGAAQVAVGILADRDADHQAETAAPVAAAATP